MVVVIHSDDSHKDKARHDTVGHGHVIQYEIKSFTKTGYDSHFPDRRMGFHLFSPSDGGIIAFLPRRMLD